MNAPDPSVRARGAGLVAFTVLVAACGGDAPRDVPDEAEATPVTTTAVQDVGPTLELRTSGRLGDRASIPLSFAIGGVVGEVSVRNGDRVEAGRLLARLDLDEIEARVSAATAAVEKAERDLARAERLYADSVATRTRLLDTRTAAEVARAELRAARFARENAEILAPAAGRVTARRAEPRQVVSAGQPIVELGEAGWRFRTGLADRDAIRVDVGMAGSVRFGVFPDAAFEARVVEIGGAADPATGTFPVELAVTDPEARLRSGLIGSATIEVPTSEALAALPVDALVSADGGRGWVYLVEDGVAHRTAVDVVALDGDRVLVRDAFPPDARVVTRGVGFVSDGDAVTEVAPEAGR